MSRQINLAPYDPRQQALDRRRALAEALQQQAYQPLESPPVPGAKISPLEGFAQLAQAIVAQHQNRKLDKEQTSLHEQLDADRKAQIAAVLAGDLQGALASPDPAMQQIAMALQQQKARTEESDKDRMAAIQRLAIQLSGDRAEKDLDRTARAEELRQTQQFQASQNALDRGSRMDIENLKLSNAGTPEEKFINLKLREAASQSGGSLDPAKEAAIRTTARQEWTAAGRENNPRMDELALQLKEIQISQAEQRLRDAQKAANSGELSPKQLSSVLSLSNSLKSHPAYVDMLDISTGIQGVESGLSQKNGFGDITAINAFQRMVDPGATVRSEDVTLLQSASSLVQRVLSEYPVEKLRTGAKLPDAVREQLRKTAEDLYERRSRNYNDSVGTQYKALAESGGFDFALVGQDFASRGAPKPSTAGVPAGVDPAVWGVMTPAEKALWPKN